MGIQPSSAYTALSFIANSPQRQTSAVATPASAASAPNVADKATISQAARDRAADETKGGGTYDFTNMTPNEMGKLVADGKIAGGFMTLTEPQFKAMWQANSQGLTGTALQDAMNVANNTPVDYVQLYTNGIRSSKAYGIDTAGLESILSQMQALQGAH
ncbi:MAG TPA: hypothetical protein VFP33_12415 [Gallionella sp.]|nr:hypothetical protein [Gallionella sp.]